MNILERCKMIAGDASLGPWKTENLTGFFQRFRPFGNGLNQIFDGVVMGEEIWERLIQIYRATENSYTPGDMYFVVRRPITASPIEVIELAKAHFAKMAEIAEVQRDEALKESINNLEYSICTTKSGCSKSLIYEDSLEAYIDDVKTDFVMSLVFDQSEAIELMEGFYSIANDLYLRDFILWPLNACHCHVFEPFQPYFELWRRGIRFRFEKDMQITIVLPQMI